MKVLGYLMFLFGVIFTSVSYGQCDVKIEFSQEKKSASSFSVFLKPEASLRNVKIELYDLYEGKVVKEKVVNSLDGNSSNEIFKDIKPSLYYIYLRFDGCAKRKGLGGSSGFRVGD